MDVGLYVAASGALNKLDWLNAHSNNLANINVPGFKKDLQLFEVHQRAEQEANANSGMRLPSNVFPGTAKIFTDFSQGQLKKTGNTFDLAINGDGFFVIQTPDGPRYTRKGDFMINSENQLVTNTGKTVMGEGGVIQLTSSDVEIAKDGTISEKGQEVGKLKLVTFEKPYALAKIGGGLYIPKDKTTKVLSVSADTAIYQHHLELSNASVVEEMVSMISALRSYETHMKLIKGYDETTSKTIALNR